MIYSVFRRALSGLNLRHTRMEIPYMEEQLMRKMKDKNFNQYGVTLLKNRTNLYKDLSIINVSYIINNDILWRHRGSLKHLERARMMNAKNSYQYKFLSKDVLLVRLFSTLYLTLHYYEDRSYRNYKEIIAWIGSLAKDYHYSFYDKNIPHEIDLDEQTNHLVNGYYMNLADSSVLIPSPNQHLVKQILYIITQFITDNGLPYSLDHLTPWLKSINAPTLSESSDALVNLPVIPLFIVTDLILRQPRTATDIEILLWYSAKYPKMFSPLTLVELPLTLKNVINGCMGFGTKSLKPFLKNILESNVSQMDDQSAIIFLNKIILFISKTNVRAPKNDFYYKDLLNCQTYLISYLSERLPDLKTGELITIEGFIGITTMFHLMGDTQAFGILSMVESEYDKVLLNMINSDDFTKLTNVTQFKEKYYASLNLKDLYAELINLRLLLATSEEVLVKEFDKLIESNDENQMLVEYPKLWTSFARTMVKFKRLTPVNAKLLWNLYRKLVLNKFDDLKNLKVDSSFIREIMNSIDNVYSILKIFKILQGKKYKMNNTILTTFFSKLYRHIHLYNKMEGGEPVDLKVYGDLLSFARGQYKNYTLNNTSRISTMLLGESTIIPEDIYEIYLSELDGKRKDENSLRALCLALIHHYYHNEKQLMWLYEGKTWKPSFEVCILEMNKHVLRDEKDVTKVFPTWKLWRKYIELLSTFDCQGEMMKIFHMWDALNYIPETELILEILVSLHPLNATRILKHGRLYLTSDYPSEIKTELEVEQMRLKSLPRNTIWPWPDEQDYANYKFHHDSNQEKKEVERLKNIYSKTQ